MKVKGLRWWIITLIGIATVINYIDRSALSIMWPSISEDLGMDKNDYALILNVFMVAYAIGQSLSGKMFDKIGSRFGFVVSITVWGLATMMHAMAKGIFSFSAFRVILGLGEAGNWPGAVKSNAEWFPVKERAMAQGIFNSGAALGSVVAPPLIAILWIAYGWQTTFILIGVLGLIWVIPWLIINKAKPNGHPWITEEEKEYIKNGQSEADNAEGKGLSMKEILSHRASWAVLISRFFIEPIWWLFVGWMPIYLADVYGFNVKEIGFFAWVPYVGAALGSLSGGYFAGRLMLNGASVDQARKRTILIGGIIMFVGLIMTIMFADTALKFVLIVALVLYGFQFVISNIQTLASDLFSGKSCGSLAGLGGTFGLFSVFIMNFLVPVITDYSYTPIFIMIAVFVPLGVGSVYWFAKEIKPIS
ncbi:ACS family hexuronate transporter-like MFS transporter [Roseivirga ehrenbergii]|uniref:MFS transporter n=1 Tax=Roseivirga ehrenbergii (strain DSM 102268 / JCM 13514 / KCTC 12282 / NCIMB 14502 / KMM 6017) TaxID=279360 RepID=A0A150X7S9_ROSEK|nr:MFS transporter [Roseivirga ehrenbergii]KYG74797.1 MFS transporter [Roseivirga ehrenbergii]TCL13871.1 ACS family hexuronate transporter-like MFS transporter [Roseivirga ehrenbergii]